MNEGRLGFPGLPDIQGRVGVLADEISENRRVSSSELTCAQRGDPIESPYRNEQPSVVVYPYVIV